MDPISLPSDAVQKLCCEVLAPLIEADGGAMYLVVSGEGSGEGTGEAGKGEAGQSDELHIHLAGTCAGCPGSALTRDRVLLPALQALMPKVKLRLTTGFRLPPHSERMGAGRVIVRK